MANLSIPAPSRIAVGSVLVNGQRLDVLLNPEWARYFDSLNSQVVLTGRAVGQPGAPGTTGAAGVGVSLSDEGGGDTEFIPGPPGAQGPAGAAGLPLFLLQDAPESTDCIPPTVAPDEAFIAPTLLNSWVNFDVSLTNPVGYYKDAGGIVHLRGFIKSGTVGSPIFTLPAGYRPTREEVFACSSNDSFGRVDVTPAGSVTLIIGSNLNASLDGITFRAAGTY